jgi:hydrogenase expression/formation protein HypC
MCLAIPGRIVEMLDPELQLAKAEVGGVRRNINIGLIDDIANPVVVGDWVLIHVGFAMSRIDEEEAAATLRALAQIGAAYEEELADLHASMIT